MTRFQRPGMGALCCLALLVSPLACKKEVSGTARTTRSGGGASAGDNKVDDSTKASDLDKVKARQDELDKKISDEIAARMKEDSNLRIDLDVVKARLDALEKKLGDEIARLDGQDKNLQDQIAKLQAKGQAVDDFIASANVKFVTRAELQNLQTTVTELENNVAILGGSVTDLDAKVDKATATLRDQLSTQIRDLKLEVATNKDEALAAIKKVDEQHMRLIKALFQQLVFTQHEVYRLGSKVDFQLPVILANLSVQVANLQSFSVKLQGDMSQKIADLQAADAKLGQDVKAARAEVIQALNAQIASDTQQKAVINAKIEELEGEIERVALQAAQTAALTEANARDNLRLRDDLQAAQAKWQKELDGMRSDFATKLAEVRTLAISVTANLGISLQQQFILLNGTLADLEQRSKLIVNIITQIFVPVVVTVDQGSKLEEALRVPTESVVIELEKVMQAERRVETAFIDAIDPILGKRGVAIAALAQSFHALQEVCVAEQGFNDPTPSLRSREWFFHLARIYVQDALFGMRTGMDDKIFFGQSVTWPQQGLAPMVMAGLTLPYGSDSEKNCYAAVQNWARDAMYGSSALALSIQDALVSQPDLGKEMVAFFQVVTSGMSSLSDWEQILRTQLIPSLGTGAGVDAFLTTADGFGVTPKSRVANQLLDRVKMGQAVEELRVERDRIFALARRTKANEADITKLQASVADLAASTERSLANVTTAGKEALQLIAAIAGRLGYDDLVTKAAAALTALGGQVDPALQNLPTQCLAAQHFYNHATDRSLPVTRCESYWSTAENPVTGDAITRCAVHGGFQQGSQLVAYTWGNRSETALGWNVQGETAGGQRVDNGLLLKHYDPTDLKAKELALRASGSVYPNDAESIFMLRVLGSAAKFKIDVKSVLNPEFDPYSVSVDAATFQVSGGANKLVYEIPLPKAIQRLGACRWDREITVTAYDKSGAPSSQKCVHRFLTFSPIVLDFAFRSRPNLISPLESPVWFDLDGDGHPEQTGWIGPKMGLLVRDVNHNGRIDDGTELFGEATVLPNSRTAANGYEALAALDGNGDGRITPQDAAYRELRVWFDTTLDGVVQAYELKSLESLGIKALDVNYESVPEAHQLDDDRGPEANLVKYQARFYGPKSCGPLGCRSYDVYFGAASSWTEATQTFVP